MNRLVDKAARSQIASTTPGANMRVGSMAERDDVLEDAIRREMNENGAYAHYFREVSCSCCAGKVLVRGCVPTNRLKQLLWSLILSLDGVTEIDDQLDVISSTGLSSIHPR
ncbi:MAG: BON domain-containing protein [Pirellulaceae bacterium]|nr:BON domain-containing protein [Pirellulaceae bacterium]